MNVFQLIKSRERRGTAMLDWCREFNKRRGYVVPPKSQRSIYLAAHKPVRKTKVFAAAAN